MAKKTQEIDFPADPCCPRCGKVMLVDCQEYDGDCYCTECVLKLKAAKMTAAKSK